MFRNLFWRRASDGRRMVVGRSDDRRMAVFYCLDRELKGREEIIGGIFQSPWNADVNFDVN